MEPHEVCAALADTLGLVVRPVAKDFANAMDTPRGPEDVAAGYPFFEDAYGDHHSAVDLCPLGVPGDKLVCKESYYIQDTHGQHRTDGLRWGSWSGLPTTISPDGRRIVYYKEGFDRCAPCWRSPATMPAWASRITLEVVGVRCVRTKDISEGDASSWGSFLGRCSCADMNRKPKTPLESKFRQTWCHIHGEEMRSLWESKYGSRHPWKTSWAWAVGVRRVEG